MLASVRRFSDENQEDMTEYLDFSKNKRLKDVTKLKKRPKRSMSIFQSEL